jgi:hypothetical protein
MLHRRTWSLSTVETAEELAEKLTEMTWCGCSAFQVRGTPYLYLNDSSSADGAQEYAVLKPDGDDFVQVESITFSWCTSEKALEYIRRISAGEFDNASYALRVSARIEPSNLHQPCRNCR